MSTVSQPTGLEQIENETVRELTRLTFLASALIFLVTIGLGFLNAMTTGTIPRWQSLTHLHSGTIGWILLSIIGVTIWLFTGGREVDESYVRGLRWLVRLAIVAFVGLIASFAYGFSQGSDAMLPLGFFAPLSALLVWAIAIFALTQLRNQQVVTTAHLLVAVGLFIAALGVSMGAWVAANYAFGGLLLLAQDKAVGAHVLTVLPAIMVIAVGILEWLVRGADAGRWSRAGMAHVVIGGLTGLVLPTAVVLILLGIPESTVEKMFPALMLGLVLFTLVFLGRIGWRALRTNPLEMSVDAWTFFATVWLVIFVAAVIGSPVLGSPDWIGILGVHAFFVGLVTNVLLGIYSVRTSNVLDRYTWTEPTAMWLLNLGIVVFVALKAMLDIRHGAMVMGVGVLLGVLTMIFRLQSDGSRAISDEATGEGVPK